MTEEQFIRNALVYGEAAVERLRNTRVAVFGVGGVGGYAVEALARMGIGTLDLIDSDVVSESNLNRQIIATHATVGRYKVDVAAERIKDICPGTTVHTYRVFCLPETIGMFDFSVYDYVLDAIDTVKGKLAIIEAAKAAGVPVISSMGAGNKTDPTAFRVTDIEKTKICPLARVMRVELRKRGIRGVKVVYSEEEARTPHPEVAALLNEEEKSKKRAVPGSLPFVPSVAGLIAAGEVIRDLIAEE